VQGLALREQIVDSVPVGDTDVALDFIVTPDGVYTRPTAATATAAKPPLGTSLASDDCQVDGPSGTTAELVQGAEEGSKSN
jgi:hypothetical protein